MKNNQPVIISSIYVDKLASYILGKNEEGKFDLYARFTPAPDNTRNIADNYRTEDIEAIRVIIDSDNLCIEDIHILANQTLWNFRNSGGVLRMAFGLIGAAVGQSDFNRTQKEPLRARTTSNLIDSFLKESFWSIQNLTRSVIATGPCTAKIPFREYGKEIELLSNIRKASPGIISLEKERLKRILTPSNIIVTSTESGERLDYIVKRLVQVVKAVSEYKQDDSFSQLRGFLNNSSHMATMLRMMSSDNPVITRLATDASQQINCTDRLLSSNAVAAGGLLTRLYAGELVYSEILDLCNHQHRLIGVEAESAMGMFTYLISNSHEKILSSSELTRTAMRIYRFAGITDEYASVIRAENYQATH